MKPRREYDFPGDLHRQILHTQILRTEYHVTQTHVNRLHELAIDLF